jgi:hypothetical protein
MLIPRRSFPKILPIATAGITVSQWPLHGLIPPALSQEAAPNPSRTYSGTTGFDSHTRLRYNTV